MNKLFTKFSAVALFAMLSGNAMATDYYLSANGVDTNDGTSAAKAVATLSKAVGLLKSNDDILHVSGLINVTSKVSVINKNFSINIQGGSSATDGFTSNGEYVDGILSLGNVKFELKNLRFENSKMAQDKTGAILNLANINGSIDNCIFSGNITEGVNTNAVGGAIFATANNTTSALTIKNSQFLNNTTGAAGGALSAAVMPVTIEGCTFEGNKSQSGGALNFFNKPSSITVKNSSFINNAVAYYYKDNQRQNGNGGAIRVFLRTLDAASTCDIEYCTFYGNYAEGQGSSMSVDGNDTATPAATRTINITNCTAVGNTTGNGAGAAFNIYGGSGTITMSNSIVEGNISGTTYVDLINSATNKSTVTIKNSVIGNISGYTDALYPATDSYINKVAKTSDIKYAGFGDLNADNQLPLIENCVAATVKGTDGKLIGAVATATETPADGTYCAATLKDDGSAATVTACRHLKGGQWNTLALPFQINKADKTDYEKLFGADAKIGVLQKVSNGVLTFENRSNAKNYDIPSQRPFIVKPVNDVVVNVTREPMAANGANVSVKDGDKVYTFNSVLNPTDLNSKINDNTQVVCLGKDGNFFKLEKDSQKTTIKGLRCYFTFPATESAARFSIGFNDGGTTGINGVNAEGAVKNAKIYTLGGQYMGTNANNLPQGVYVIGNKKVVVK